MFYAQCDNIGSMYKLAVKVIDDVNNACTGGHLHSHGIYFYSTTASILDWSVTLFRKIKICRDKLEIWCH
jgi:hypothetical protein